VHTGAIVLRRLIRALTASVCCRQLQHITLQPIDADVAAAVKRRDDGTMEGVTITTIEAFDALAGCIPSAFRDSVDELRRRVGRGCVLSLARSRRDGGSVVGYELAERAIFSALGRRHAVSAEIVFSHWAEVLPAYRGQRVHALLFATRDAYFQPRGARVVCGVVAPRNRASLRALRRAGSVVVGTVQRVTLFQSLVAWETPWHRIQRALDGAVPQNVSTVLATSPAFMERKASFRS
jgi:GNAT superfamily N-acetyltransferase